MYIYIYICLCTASCEDVSQEMIISWALGVGPSDYQVSSSLVRINCHIYIYGSIYIYMDVCRYNLSFKQVQHLTTAVLAKLREADSSPT